MELTSEEECFALYFTRSHSQDFTFIIAIPNGSIQEISDGNKPQQVKKIQETTKISQMETAIDSTKRDSIV